MDEHDATKGALLARFPLFAQLPAPRLDGLLAACPVRRLPAGVTVFEPDMPCTAFPLVLDGSIRVSKTSPTGREIVLYRVGPGEGCILSGGCLLGQTDYSARGATESEATLLAIPPAQFQDLMVHFPPFRRFVFDMYGARLAEVMEVVEEVAFRRLDTRLAQLLVQRGPVIHATHQALDDELGSVRVIVSRLLRNFEERGWVRLERERITVLDLRGLAAFARQ